MPRYGAKLLFQFRVDINGDSGKQRVCEERILNLQARSAREVLRKARAYGKKAQYQYLNADGNQVYFELVGVLDLYKLDITDAQEVWCDIYNRLQPMERRKRFVPDDGWLLTRAK